MTAIKPTGIVGGVYGGHAQWGYPSPSISGGSFLGVLRSHHHPHASVTMWYVTVTGVLTVSAYVIHMKFMHICCICTQPHPLSPTPLEKALPFLSRTSYPLIKYVERGAAGLMQRNPLNPQDARNQSAIYAADTTAKQQAATILRSIISWKYSCTRRPIPMQNTKQSKLALLSLYCLAQMHVWLHDISTRKKVGITMATLKPESACEQRLVTHHALPSSPQV